MKIIVAWPANPTTQQVTSYDVYQSTTGGQQVLAGSVPASPSPTFEVVDPAPGFQYSFQIVAVNLAGKSAKSALVSTAPAPATPTGVTVTVEP